jgi:hypothetical protein
MIVSAGLRFLYSFLFREFLVSFFYPTPPLVWSVFHNIAAFVLGLYPTYEKEHAA